ncbi:hypothetical protein TNCV_350131 [Trichonephila clavipes]|nr:hypothetical protein TNCV_350131 [Trichonephila clavipes]
MDVCNRIVALRHGATLNSRRAASPLAWLVEEEERSAAVRQKIEVLRSIGECAFAGFKHSSPQRFRTECVITPTWSSPTCVSRMRL